MPRLGSVQQRQGKLRKYVLNYLLTAASLGPA